MDKKRTLEHPDTDLSELRLATLLSRPLPDPALFAERGKGFQPNEVGLIHPYHTSMVKLRSNGAVDIFVGTNTGIRVDPAKAMISLFSPQLVEQLGEKHTYLSGDCTTESKRTWTVKAKEIHLEAEGDIRLKAGGKIHFD